MNVLIGCERGGRVRDAFRRLGHNAWSCDLEPADDGSPYHFAGDVFDAIFNPEHVHEEFGAGGFAWNLGIFHPPCDFLTVSGNRWFKPGVKANRGTLTGHERRRAQGEALAFVLHLWNCPIPRIGLENPIGRLSSLWMKPTQIVQPTQFGEPHRKATCLWLKNLPPLLPTHVPEGDLLCDAEPRGEQLIWKMPPSPDRKRLRSLTFQSIAKAMAAQWGTLT